MRNLQRWFFIRGWKQRIWKGNGILSYQKRDLHKKERFRKLDQHLIIDPYFNLPPTDTVGAQKGGRAMNATTSTLYIAIVLPLVPRNPQGDIVAVYNQSGAKIGTYIYDAWGNHTVTAASGISTQESQVLNTLNPSRYRGCCCSKNTFRKMQNSSWFSSFYVL